LFPLLSANNIEKAQVSGIAMEGEDLNPQVNNDAWMEPVGEIKVFPYQRKGEI